MTKHHAVKHARQCNRYAVQFKRAGQAYYAKYYAHLARTWLATARRVAA
jgi:hypothetical protein